MKGQTAHSLELGDPGMSLESNSKQEGGNTRGFAETEGEEWSQNVVLPV